MPTDKTPSGKQVCASCKKEKRYVDFYASSSEIFSLTGRVPICKKCMLEKCMGDDGEINLNDLHDVLRQIDKPFVLRVWQSALNEADKYKLTGKNRSERAFSYYFKNINSLKQYKHFTYKDSDEVNKRMRVDEGSDIKIKQIQNRQDAEEKHYTDISDFEVTSEIKDLFGDGYTTVEYKNMFEKYEKLKLNYSLQTNLHQEALATYVRFKVKEEEATALGNVDEAKKWYDAAQNAAEKAKLTPKQLTKADLQSGVNSISELSKALEQAVDVIKILPQFKYRANDAPDFNIYCYVNYERELNGQPQVDYSEIYSFYDKKKKEYIAQNGDPYGIFTNDTTEKNRDIVKTFIKLPDDYEDLAGDKNGD